MFSSLTQALGVDSTFFVQFLIFLLFYPVLSRLLFRPYCQLQDQRERETVERMKQAEKLKEKKQILQKEYEKTARHFNEEFNKTYNEESKKLKEIFLKQRIKNQKKTQKEYEQKNKTLLQEIKEAEAQMQSEINQLTKEAVDRLVS